MWEMQIEVYCTLEELKKFLVESTGKTKFPRKYMDNPNILFERRNDVGKVYIEAESKKDLEQIEDIVVVEVNNVLGVEYISRSGRTRLKWRQLYKDFGKLFGEASPNTIVNLYEAGIRDIRVLKKEDGGETNG